MERLIPRIREISERIVETEERRRKLGEFLRSVSGELDIIKNVRPSGLDGVSVAAVDGGIAKKSLHGFDAVLVRAAGVRFAYVSDRVDRVDYFPSRIPVPHADIIEALSDLEWSYFTSLMRMGLEARLSSECIDRFSPTMLLMDGSIVPHHMDRPSRNSRMYERYLSVVDDYRNLYEKAQATGTALAGVIEDSRGVSFCKMVKEDILSRISHPRAGELASILDKTRDTNLLYWALKKGERSSVFPYSESAEEHPVLKDFGEWGKRVWSFYLKTAERDRPVRVDFLSRENPEKEADSISSILLPISGQHSEYGLPAPLIEADNVAKLSEEEVENFYSNIISFTGNIPGVMKLRRETRPF